MPPHQPHAMALFLAKSTIGEFALERPCAILEITMPLSQSLTNPDRKNRRTSDCQPTARPVGQLRGSTEKIPESTAVSCLAIDDLAKRE